MTTISRAKRQDLFHNNYLADTPKRARNQPNNIAELRYKDELDTQIDANNSQFYLDSLKTQCEELELTLKQRPHYVFNQTNYGLSSEDQKNIYYNELFKTVRGQLNENANKYYRSNAKEAQTRHADKIRVSPFDAEPERSSCQCQAILKPNHKSCCCRPQSGKQDRGKKTVTFDSNMNREIEDVLSVQNVKDNVREAKMLEKQRRFESYLKTDFTDEVI